jgi:hypothetical protein
MRNATMGTPLLMTCSPYATCASRRVARRKPALRTRLAKLAIVLAALYVMVNGELWVLEHSPTAANELIVATCAADAVFGGAVPANACTSTGTSDDTESNNE